MDNQQSRLLITILHHLYPFFTKKQVLSRGENETKIASMVKETAPQVLELSRRHKISEYAVKSARKRILDGTDEPLRTLLYYLFYRLQLYSTAKQLGQAKSDPNIAYEYLSLESIDLATSLKTASTGDYTEIKQEMQNQADDLLSWKSASDKYFARKMIALTYHVPDKGKPIDLPQLPWEDQDIIRSYNQDLKVSNRY